MRGRRGHAILLAGALLACTRITGSSSPAGPNVAPPSAAAVVVEPPPPEPVSPPESAAAIVALGYTPEIAELLAARFVDWHTGPTRLALRRRGHVRLAPEGPALGLGDLAPFDPAPRFRVVRDEERPLVVTDGDVRLLVHVQRADAAPVIARRAPLRPSPTTVLGDPPRRGHVVLLPGAWVDVVERRDGAVKVAYAYEDPMGTDDLHASGWVDADAIGSTGTILRPEDRPTDTVLIARRPTPLLRTPGGKRLARVDADEAVFVLRPRKADGMHLVEHEPPCVDVHAFVGFVAARNLWHPYTNNVHGCGRVGDEPPPPLWGEAEAAPRVHVAAGRFLIDTASPTVVGCVVRATELADLGDERVAVPTMWGPLAVALAPEDFGGECGTRR